MRSTAATLAWLWPQAALACSVCFSATEETREAYYLTTALLGSLPLLMAVGLVLWLRRVARRGSDEGRPPDRDRAGGRHVPQAPRLS